MIRKQHFFSILFTGLFISGNAFAIESVPITFSPDRNQVIFDGKWSFFWEWKRSSLTEMSGDNDSVIELRTAHQDNFIYVFVDAVSDTSLDKGADRAMVCIDSKDDKSITPNSDDFCFVAILDGKSSFVLQGGSPLGVNYYFEKIPNPPGFIGVGGVSDENDRYTNIPHPGYEFKIPTDLVGRSDVYGFYVSVYDAHSNKYYSWPKEVNQTNNFHVASPSEWSELVSPDKSLPEFPWPLVTLLPAFFFVIYFTRVKSRNFSLNIL